MKKYWLIIAFATGIFLHYCQDDDKDKPGTLAKGSAQVALFFDHGINGDQLLIQGGSGFKYDSVEGEVLQDITALDYVISNIELTDESGETFKFPTDSLFIVSVENKENKVVLDHIPSGKYVSITFGIGVPYKKWAEGLTAQEEFFDKALSPKYNIAWSWASGYKNLRFEGSVHSEEKRENDLEPEPRPFFIHLGDHLRSGLDKPPEQDNYRKITCPFHEPEVALLADNKTITIHFRVDAGKILNGKNKIKLFDNNCSIMFNPKIDPKIADNLTDGMFTVDHVESYDAH